MKYFYFVTIHHCVNVWLSYKILNTHWGHWVTGAAASPLCLEAPSLSLPISKWHCMYSRICINCSSKQERHSSLGQWAKQWAGWLPLKGTDMYGYVVFPGDMCAKQVDSLSCWADVSDIQSWTWRCGVGLTLDMEAVLCAGWTVPCPPRPGLQAKFPSLQARGNPVEEVNWIVAEWLCWHAAS